MTIAVVRKRCARLVRVLLIAGDSVRIGSLFLLLLAVARVVVVVGGGRSHRGRPVDGVGPVVRRVESLPVPDGLLSEEGETAEQDEAEGDDDGEGDGRGATRLPTVVHGYDYEKKKKGRRSIGEG